MSFVFHDMYGKLEILDVFDSVLLPFSLSGECIYFQLILLFRVSCSVVMTLGLLASTLANTLQRNHKQISSFSLCCRRYYCSRDSD